MIDFENRETYWIAIDIANQYGLDKKSFEYRVNWVKENFDNLQDFVDEADSTWEYVKAVKALWQLRDGLVPQHMVYLDASNQALQLYAVLTGDFKTASTCNFANKDNMADAYKMLADQMNIEMGLTCFNRSNCKKALMTTMYGKISAWAKILEEMYPKSSNPLLNFATEYNLTLEYDEEKGIDRLLELERAFSNALSTIAPKAISAMEAIQELNNKDIGTYYWTLLDGFRVKYNVKVETKIECETVSRSGKKLTLSISKDIYVSGEHNRGMSPNVIHSVDGYVAREMIRRMNGKFITTIHDAFACHPSDCDLMRKNYQDIMVELLHSDLLNDILSQISGTKMEMNKDNGLTEEHIRTSQYYLG